jgi:hypothetical protein
MDKKRKDVIVDVRHFDDGRPPIPIAVFVDDRRFNVEKVLDRRPSRCNGGGSGMRYKIRVSDEERAWDTYIWDDSYEGKEAITKWFVEVPV